MEKPSALLRSAAMAMAPIRYLEANRMPILLEEGFDEQKATGAKSSRS
jgi:hypothetical protein